MQVSIAPYTDADAPAVAAFLTSAAQRDPTLEPIELSAWRSFVARSFNSNGRDFAIARTGAELVAVLMSARYEDRGQTLRNVRIIVDPARRGAGWRPLELAVRCPRRSASASRCEYVP